MKSKKFHISKKLISVLMAAAIILTFVILPAQSVSASSSTNTNKKAIAAYKRMLSKETYHWSSVDYENQTSKFSFACVDLNGDGVKELIVHNSSACHASGYYKIFAYVNNRVKCVKTCADVVWYKKAKVIGIDDAHTGFYTGVFYKLSKKGKLVNKASYRATDMKEYAKHVKHREGGNGLYIYYTSYKINGKETSYKKYKKAFKKLIKTKKYTSLNFKENNYMNRANMK